MQDSTSSHEASTEAAKFSLMTLSVSAGRQDSRNYRIKNQFRLEYKMIFTKQKYDMLNTIRLLLNTKTNY